jgi:hypothetical protein
MAAWRSLGADETWDLVAYLRAPADWRGVPESR